MPDSIIYHTDKGVATIMLNRPDRLNAMNDDLVAGVLAALEEAATDYNVRVVVLTGAGRGFCAGGDLGTIDVERPPLERDISALRRQHRTAELLHDMPKVTIAAVNGACAGAGLSWACAADLRIAAASAVFRTAFLSAAMTGDMGGTWSLTEIVGSAKARELYLLNRKFSADEALSMGLVSEVVGSETFADRVRELAESLAAAAPIALRGIKQNLNDAQRLDFSATLDAEAERHMRAARSADCIEAAAAFIEKRPPTFTGN